MKGVNVDFLFWDTLKDFTIVQIVDLWVKGDGLKYDQAVAINRMIKKAVALRQIPCPDMKDYYDCEDWRDIEDHWTIARTDIKNWCKSEGHKPAFLFPEVRESGSEDTLFDPDSPTYPLELHIAVRAWQVISANHSPKISTRT